MAKVKLEKITRQFGNFTAIENITFEIPDGEFWVFVGPSGCGKSTILRTIAGLESASSGNIYLGDCLVNDIPARQRDVAMVFQNYALYPHMSVAENLAFGLKMRQVDRMTIDQRVETVARSLNIHHLLKRKPKQLSGGQQQRVALGRAIARQPQVFLLDEPLSNLDAQLRDDTRAELKQLHDRLGVTTIYVTHDQTEAMTLADRIVVLDRGCIQQIATPQQIYNQPANRMVANFIGNPPMNIIPVTYSDNNLLVCDRHLALDRSLCERLKFKEGKKLDLGIRPEDIAIVRHFQSDRSNLSSQNCGQLEVEVQVVEPLGRETLVRCIIPNSEIIVNFYAPPSWQGYPRDFLTVKLDMEQLFFFDSLTTKNLNY